MVETRTQFFQSLVSLHTMMSLHLTWRSSVNEEGKVSHNFCMLGRITNLYLFTWDFPRFSKLRRGENAICLIAVVKVK